MKEKDKQRLYADLIKYCDQIGILPEETPMLYLDRNEYNAVRKLDSSRGVRHSLYGECNYEQRAIFVNARQSKYQVVRYLTKIGSKRTGYRAYYKTVKATYRHKLHTLIHELVHYRFNLSHGLAFEKRIKEILAGRRFEPMSVVEEKGFKWRISGITRMPQLSIEERIGRVKKSAEFLYKQHYAEGKTIADILPELKSKYSKYIDGKEIEAGFNLFVEQEKGS